MFYHYGQGAHYSDTNLKIIAIEIFPLFHASFSPIGYDRSANAQLLAYTNIIAYNRSLLFE